MTASRTRAWPARMTHLAEATAFVESFCAANDVARTDALRLVLVVEELFTNTVVHGHGGDCDAPVRIGLEATTARVDLVYEDSAPPFDPVAHLAASAAALDADADDRRVGGAGIELVLGLATQVRYLRENDANRLCLTIARQPE